MDKKIPGNIILFFLLLFALPALADDYSDGWNAFLNNKRSEARNFFTKATKNSSTAADAWLSLALIDWQEMNLDNAFKNFRQFYQASNEPYPYLYGISSLPFFTGSNKAIPKEKLDFFQKIVADPKMNGTLKAMLCQDIGSHFEATNDMKTAKEWYGRMGAINKWQVLGTFDNTSGSGFSKDWGVVDKPLSTDVFKNKVDAEIKWYTPPFNKFNNWFYFDFYFVLNNTIEYAQTFVNSPVDQTVYMRTGTSGSLKIWVNDVLTTSVSEERNCDLDIYISKIKLNKGFNRILVQIGQNEISNANFLLRLTDENGNQITGISSQPEYAAYQKSAEKNDNPELLPFFAEEYFIEKIKMEPDNYLDKILLAEVYLRNDKAYEATKVLKSLGDKAAISSFVMYRLAEAYSRAKNQTDYDKEMESIKNTDPESFYALELLYNEAINSEKYIDADSICSKVKRLYGTNETTDQWDINIAVKQKDNQRVIDLGKQLYKKYPDNVNYMYVNYMIDKNVSNNPKSSLDILENFCQKYYDNTALTLLSNAYFDMGNTDKGLSILYDRSEKMPYATGYLDNLTGKLFKMQRYKDALDVNRKALDMAPYISDYYNTQGYIYKNLNNNQDAIESFRKAIYYAPTSYDSRQQLRLLENKKDLYDLFEKNDMNKIISGSPTAQDYPESNSVILLNDNQLIVYPEGAKESRVELAIKILNQAGIESWKEYTISYNSNNQHLIIDKSEVIKSNGNRVKAETDNDNNIVFTNLEINDVLHIDYRIQDFSTGKLANQFSDHLLFQYFIPSVINRYSVLVPNDKKFNYVVTNGNVEPKITDIENMKMYKWESDNQPAVKTEPQMSELIDVAPTLFFSSIPDWKYVSNWYKDLTTSKFNPDYVLKETFSSLIKGHENDSQLEKAKIFYDYILNNITYSSVSFLQSNFIPQKASRTITTRLGDCKDVSTLFVALCREAGINANLVLILTRDNGNNSLPLPSVYFNHCIAQLNINNKAYYLELTNNTLPFGAALAVDLKSKILPIPFADEAFGDKQLIDMDMSFRPKNRITRTHNITVINNDLQISRRNVYYASDASELRDNNKNIGSDEQLKKLNEAIASDFTTPVKVSALKFTNLDNLADSLVIEYKIDVKKAFQDVAGMKIIKLPWSGSINSLELVNAEQRTYPIELWQYSYEDFTTETINFELPKGKNLVETPLNIHLECENASYDLKFDCKTPGMLKAKRMFTRKSEQIKPDQYAKFQEFINKVSEADNKQIAIK